MLFGVGSGCGDTLQLLRFRGGSFAFWPVPGIGAPSRPGRTGTATRTRNICRRRSRVRPSGPGCLRITNCRGAIRTPVRCICKRRRAGTPRAPAPTAGRAWGSADPQRGDPPKRAFRRRSGGAAAGPPNNPSPTSPRPAAKIYALYCTYSVCLRLRVGTFGRAIYLFL